ncbi:MAG: DUF393 domain-containing protein [Saprospiraceae bacterium]|nr:DUF393 domain-containing protein [Saprospiraceae bacterium]
METFKKILLYDGDCGFCQNIVLWVFAREKSTADPIYFGALTSALGKNILSIHQLPKTLDSIVLVENDKVYVKSRAVFRVCSMLTFPYSVGKHLAFLPLWLTDTGYDFIASLRKRLTGKMALCELPDARLRERLIG